jgi:pimeloyl-ACP methyl ester carboxylesterase
MISSDLYTGSINNEIFFTANKDMAGKTPILLLMGYAGTVDSWTTQVLNAFASEWPIIAVDLPGNGRSIKSIDPKRLSYAAIAQDIEVILDHFGVQSAHILGYSYGGTIAMSFAQMIPARVKSLTLVATTLGGKDYVSPPKEILIELGAPPGQTLEEKTESIWRICLGRDKLPSFRHVMAVTLEKQKDSLTPGWVLREQLKNYLTFSFSDRAKQLPLPVLVITGEEDPLTPAENSTRISEAFPNAELTIIEGCRHMPHVEEPGLFTDSVLGFIAGRAQS